VRESACAFSSDAALASGSDQASEAQGRTLEKLLKLRGRAGYVSSMAFLSDGRTVATGSWDKTVKLWIAATTADKMIARSK
jgi:WD40 repeat protein